MNRISLTRCFCIIIFGCFLNLSILSQSDSVNQNSSITNTPAQETPQTISKETKPSQWATDFKEIGGLWATLATAVFLLLLILLIIFRKELSKIIRKLAESNISGFKLGKDGLGFDFENNVASEKIKEVKESSEKQSPEGDEKNEKIEEIKQIAEESINEQEKDSQKLFGDFIDIGFGTGHIQELEDIYSKLKLEQKDAKEKSESEAYFLYFSYKKGNGSSLEDLKKLAKKEEEVSAFAYFLVGVIYADNRNLEKAKEFYELSKAYCKDDFEKAEKTVSIAKVYFRVGKADEASSYLKKEISSNSDEKIFALLYKELAAIYKDEDEKYNQVMALEKVLEYSPEDSDARFDIAYVYNKLDKKHLSLFHYLKYLEFYSNNSGVMNNLGVVYNNLEMPIKAVGSYEKSSKLGHTLASSNLAYKYIDEGFSTQAEEILNSAKLKSDPHPNVAKATARLSDNKEQEDKTEKSLIKNAVEQQLFYRNYAELYLAPVEDKIIDLSGNWEVENEGKASITQNDNKFEFFPNENSEYYKIEGTIAGLTANITKLKKEKKLYSTSDEFTYNLVKSGIAYISKDYKEIKIMFPEKETTEFIRLSKK